MSGLLEHTSATKTKHFSQKNASFSLQSGARLHKRRKSYSGDNFVQAGVRRKSYLLQKEISQVLVASVKDPWPHFINAKQQTFLGLMNVFCAWVIGKSF